jgi:hypothetical protein
LEESLAGGAQPARLTKQAKNNRYAIVEKFFFTTIPFLLLNYRIRFSVRWKNGKTGKGKEKIMGSEG